MRPRKSGGSRGDHYELANGTHIDFCSSPVWCRQCDEFTDGESIEVLEEIDRQIADLRYPTSELFGFIRESGTDSIGVEGIRFITELEKRRRWRDRRKSPPKCLTCGSMEIVLLPDKVAVTNPTGSGWIEVTVTGHCSTLFMNRFYTPEGDRIPKDTKPTYARDLFGIAAVKFDDSLDKIELIVELEEEFDKETILWALRYIESKFD